ncbi:hypothetical protein V6N12_039409 [Hibiscus sabdariffa]|uniref:Uncharacterized protein n=1 Tax=Hibiscus sabdariffa TaxID=183260 RepID=A0ABR2E0N2_9ROSI
MSSVRIGYDLFVTTFSPDDRIFQTAKAVYDLPSLNLLSSLYVFVHKVDVSSLNLIGLSCSSSSNFPSTFSGNRVFKACKK